MTDFKLARRLVNLYQSAEQRGISCTLSLRRLKQLHKQTKCFYTGVEFAEQGPHMMTLDRVDASIGYHDDNVVACTCEFNQKKKDLTIDEVVLLYKKILTLAKQKHKKDVAIQEKEATASKTATKNSKLSRSGQTFGNRTVDVGVQHRKIVA